MSVCPCGKYFIKQVTAEAEALAKTPEKLREAYASLVLCGEKREEEPTIGVEPTTYSLRMNRSTS